MSESVTLLGHVIAKSDIDEAKERLGDSDATHEVLMVIALFLDLATSTHDHASDLVADGFTLRAEEADQRSIRYANSADALCKIWKEDGK